MNIRLHNSIRRPGLVLLALSLAFLATLPASGTDGGPAPVVSREYQIKAAFLLNFTRYVEWPKRSSDLTVCVLGPDVFGSSLNDAIAGRVVNGRKIAVRQTASAAQAASCDLVYVSLSGAHQTREALKTLESSAVLTVGEDADFLHMGGMIAFTVLDGKVRFYINEPAAVHAGIAISSRLMVLGRNLRDEGERRR
jgi:hypothetical protein